MNDASKKSVAAVVVTFNRKELLKECIDALLSQTFQNLNIFIIDNASTDGTQEYIENYIHEQGIIYINTETNLGGAGGFNYGIRVAVERNYEYIWLLDDDTIVFPNTLSELMNVAEKLDYNFGFLSSYVQFTDGSPCIMNIPSVQRPEWIYQQSHLSDGLLVIESASFVSFLLPQKIVLKKGLPIKEFFIWGDDVEYSRRISKDYPCFFANQSVVTHKMSANEEATENSFINYSGENKERLERYRYKFRNSFFIAKEKGRMEAFRYARHFLRLNIRCLRSKKYCFKKLRILWRGYTEGVFFNPPIEKV